MFNNDTDLMWSLVTTVTSNTATTRITLIPTITLTSAVVITTNGTVTTPPFVTITSTTIAANGRATETTYVAANPLNKEESGSKG